MAGTTVFNLDELTCGFVEITKTVCGRPRTWRLRDDVETRILLRGFQLSISENVAERARALFEERQERQERHAEQQGAEGDGGQVRAPTGAEMAALLAHVMDDYQRDVRDFFLEIARWSYPDRGPDGDEAEQLTDALTHDERDRIIGHFFTLRFGSLSEQLASLPTPEAEVEKPARQAAKPVKATPVSAAHRASRKAGGRASTRPM